MSFYTKLVSGLLFPLHEKLKKHNTVAIKQSLEASQWWPRDKLIAQRNLRLQRFIQKVCEHIPYYRDTFAQLGLTPADIQSPADLTKLPFLDKQTIKDNFEQLKDPLATSLARFNTGGSSGEPLVFMLSNERVSHDVAEKWRATRWWNVDIGDKEIVAWGSPIELGAQDKVRLLRDKLFRSTLIPAFDMNEEKILAFIEHIRATRPAMLFGYPSVFDLIAKTANQHGIDMKNLGIKVAFVTSERLYPYQRENIQTTFGCPVANGYGGRDAGFIAHECPSGNMHLSFEDLIVEIIDPNGNPLPVGEKGEIVVTHMATSEFPFIRYRTGDIGALSDKQCDCGRTLPILESIEGRSTDFVIGADGTIMHGLSLIYILRDIQDIKTFKIIQHSVEETEVQLILKNAADLHDDMRHAIIAKFQQRLGEQVSINVHCVEDIPAEKSGKYRYVISKVSTA